MILKFSIRKISSYILITTKNILICQKRYFFLTLLFDIIMKKFMDLNMNYQNILNEIQNEIKPFF